jgi:serine/threonine-protein kinase/endoribonuclease IRE1
MATQRRYHMKKKETFQILFSGPLIESPVNVQRGFTFIPDPRDGQLYLVIEGRLSKLPFTIPHLVRVSPCKSSDGVFYAG